MTHDQTFTIFLSVIGGLFSLMVMMLFFFGKRVLLKLDENVKALNDLAGKLHERINSVDRRVVAIEVECDMRHNGSRGP